MVWAARRLGTVCEGDVRPHPRVTLNVFGAFTSSHFNETPKQPAIEVPWNRVGLTHISFNVRNLQKWYDHLQRKGVDLVSRPERSPRGHSFFFCRDCDGNLIEMMDLGYMYYVLGWLGPLCGWLFRRGMYQQYYR